MMKAKNSIKLTSIKYAVNALLFAVFNFFMMPIQALVTYVFFYSVEPGQSFELDDLKIGIQITNTLYVISWILSAVFIAKICLLKPSKKAMVVVLISGAILILSFVMFGRVVIGITEP